MTQTRMSEKYFPLGQLFMVGLPGPVLDGSTLKLIGELGINNFIYFKRNAENAEQLKKLSKDLTFACRDKGLAPPLIAIDQEGGTVARLPPPFTQFPDARILAASAEPEESLITYARVCAGELRSIGVNFNLAPVLDVCAAGKDYFMEKRALGDDPDNVGRLGVLIIREMQAQGIAACGKHFPGLGAAIVDPHLQLPLVANPEQYIRTVDLEPFRQAIDSGVAAIMTSHTIYQYLDPENPATLSGKILTGLLRDELGYGGVIITDDLEMGAIEQERDVGQAALQAFAAGADLLLICRSHAKVIAAYRKTAEAIAAYPALGSRMQESLQRVQMLREKFGTEKSGR